MPRFLFALCLLMLAACEHGSVGEMAAPPAQAEPTVRARRCLNCGWIESKREIRADAYEYTVRMADGSSRVFQETLPTSWRLRERLMVIDGRGPLN